MAWSIKQLSKIKVKNSILIEGLPGMGNVGKIAVDFLIDALDAKKVYEFSSYDLPHCVFVNEDNLVELPSINLYYKNISNKSILLLAGDIQPISESSCYEFCNAVLDTVKKLDSSEIITIGGIALPKIPKDPKVFCTGNSKKIVSTYDSTSLVTTNIHGRVGPIIGVSGLLPGLASKHDIPAVALLAETFGHPNYIGIKGARNILRVLNKRLKLNLDLKDLDEEVSNLEQEFMQKNKSLGQLTRILKKKMAGGPPAMPQTIEDTDAGEEGMNYIG